MKARTRSSLFITRTLASLVLAAALGAIGATTVSVPSLPDDPAANATDKKLMARAIELSASAVAHGNSAYGALLLNPDGTILMEGENDARTSGDVTHHAETGLISAACKKYGREAVGAATLYTSTEPCIMCCGSIRAAGIKRFFYGVTAVQVGRLRGNEPKNPLQCREVFERIGLSSVVIIGPLLEGDGLKVHADAIVKTAAAAK